MPDLSPKNSGGGLPVPECGYWNVHQAAQYLAMSEGFVRKFIRLRKIPFTKVGSKAVRLSKAELDAWLECQDGRL